MSAPPFVLPIGVVPVCASPALVLFSISVVSVLASFLAYLFKIAMSELVCTVADVRIQINWQMDTSPIASWNRPRFPPTQSNPTNPPH